MLLLFLFDVKKTQQNNQTLRALVSWPMRRENRSNESFLLNRKIPYPITLCAHMQNEALKTICFEETL